MKCFVQTYIHISVKTIAGMSHIKYIMKDENVTFYFCPYNQIRCKYLRLPWRYILIPIRKCIQMQVQVLMLYFIMMISSMLRYYRSSLRYEVSRSKCNRTEIRRSLFELLSKHDWLLSLYLADVYGWLVNV